MTLKATRWDIHASVLRLDSHVLQPYEAQSQSETPDEQHDPVPNQAAEEPPYDIRSDRYFFDVCYCLLVPSAGSHSRTLQYDSYGMDASGGPLRGDILFPQQHLELLRLLVNMDKPENTHLPAVWVRRLLSYLHQDY
jgi:hypothetical protein